LRGPAAARAGDAPAAIVLPVLPGTPARMSHDYKRNGASSLFTALDAATGNVIVTHPGSSVRRACRRRARCGIAASSLVP